MRKLIVHMTTGYPAEAAYDAMQVPEDWTDEEISDEAWYMACQHAESYGHPHNGEVDTEDEDYYYDEWFSEYVGADWEDYVPEKHDMFRSGGGSFSEDFD
jgi:hypothetical protein